MNNHSHGDVMRRRETILAVIRDTAVHSQEELMALLRRRGFRVTQPTLSRDVRELGLAKTPSGYVEPGALASVTPINTFPRFEQIVRDSLLFAEAAGNLVVVKTPAAAAQPLASAIDGASIEDVLGTVGGDDTIFIALRTPQAASAFARRLHRLAGIGVQQEAK
jgi:transcriptional regulator of arginine metabolism